jgi:hypothetical protein
MGTGHRNIHNQDKYVAVLENLTAILNKCMTYYVNYTFLFCFVKPSTNIGFGRIFGLNIIHWITSSYLSDSCHKHIKVM